METPATCPICKQQMGGDCLDHLYLVELASKEGEPLAFVIDCQRFYHSSAAKARALTSVFKELKEEYPDKQFDIQPSLLTLTRKSRKTDDEFGILLGYSHISVYLILEV